MSVKEEYESLNGTLRKGKFIYQSVTIDDSIIDSVSIKDAIEIYKNSDESTLYFGANWCPWCRSLLPVLIKYAKKENKRITYINMDKKRPIYIKTDGKYVLDYKGDDEYQLLINEFKDIMTNCVAKVGEELEEVPNTYNISLPLVLFGSNGAIISYHYGGVDLKENQTPYDLFDSEQEKELFDIFESHKNVIGMTCDIHGCSIK